MALRAFWHSLTWSVEGTGIVDGISLAAMILQSLRMQDLSGEFMEAS